MALVLRSIYNWYHWLFHDYKDARVDSYPLTSSPMLIVTIVAAYVYFVTDLGQRYTKNRPAYDLSGIIKIYNLIQIFVNLYIGVILSLGEVMFSVTGLAFSYEQAPESMKSVVQALWQLTVAFGNLILLSIAKSAFFEKQSNEFFLFSALMSIDMLIFVILAYKFKSRTPVEVNSNENYNLEHHIVQKTEESSTL